jgi:hypothetical protein
MKVCIIMTGQLRTFELCKYVIKNSILKHYDTDIFLSIDLSNELQNVYFNSSKITDDEIIKKAINFYNPIDYFICNSYEKEFLKMTEKLDPNVLKLTKLKHLKLIFEQYYIVYKGYEMVENYIKKTNIIYDIVFRIRFDSLLFPNDLFKYLNNFQLQTLNTRQILCNEFNIQKMDEYSKNMIINIENIDKNTLYTRGVSIVKNYNILNDPFFYHDFDLINILKNFYINMPNILNNCIDKWPSSGAWIEHFFYIYIVEINKINIKQSKIHTEYIREKYVSK